MGRPGYEATYTVLMLLLTAACRWPSHAGDMTGHGRKAVNFDLEPPRAAGKSVVIEQLL